MPMKIAWVSYKLLGKEVIKLKAISITEQEYLENSESLTGYCTGCQEFTTSCVEPDAEEYSCEDCEKKTVYGTEQALLMGLVDIS